MKAWAVEMTAGLESSDEPSAKNCQRQFSSLFACCTKQQKKINLSCLFILVDIKDKLYLNKLRLFFAEGCGVWHREAVQICDMFCLLQFRNVGTLDWILFVLCSSAIVILIYLAKRQLPLHCLEYHSKGPS